MDTLSPQKRSELMSRIRSKDTKPELVIRRLLHGLGYRYVLHDKRLPGRPDLVFPARRAVVLVNGCFWHGHHRTLGSRPKTNSQFWSDKIAGNRNRDAKNMRALRMQGWRVLVVWECVTRVADLTDLENRLIGFLGARRAVSLNRK